MVFTHLPSDSLLPLPWRFEKGIVYMKEMLELTSAWKALRCDLKIDYKDGTIKTVQDHDVVVHVHLIMCLFHCYVSLGIFFFQKVYW